MFLLFLEIPYSNYVIKHDFFKAEIVEITKLYHVVLEGIQLLGSHKMTKFSPLPFPAPLFALVRFW